MVKFALIRLLQFPLILAVIYLITFALAWIAPGSPFEKGDRTIDSAALEQLRKSFHADRWYEFLGHYPSRVILERDFGPSMFYKGWSVNDILATSLPVSVTLGVFALLIAVVVGVVVGSLAAVRRGGALDYVSLSIALTGVSVPSFVVAGVLLTIFSVNLQWVPIGTWGSWRDILLPGLALSLMPMAYIARLTRVAMIDVLSADYIRTARAKGLSKSSVIWKHALRNAFLPVLSYLGPAAAVTLTGSFVVEKVFNIPGLGVHFVNSVLNRDQTLILGVVMVYSVFLLSFNLLVDIAYAWIDPRIDMTSPA